MKDIGFFAYGSAPASSGECIEEAIKKINEEDNIEIYSWKKLQISGNLIITKIIEAIDNCDFFCADLTGLNNNVLFELGYAIAKDKPIFLINDTSHDESLRKYKEFNILSTFGYCAYTKTDDIVNSFFKEQPFNPIDNRYWKQLTQTLIIGESRSAVLILNSQVDSNYNQEVINQAEYYKLPTIVDDASESKVQPLSWYIQQIHNVLSFLAQFSSTVRVGAEIHNAKCSLISGIALGRGIRVKMIAEKPYESPIDYREVLQKFSNRQECEKIVSEYFKFVQKDIGQLLGKKEENLLNTKRTDLQRLNFGEAIAEHESTTLSNYFIETANITSLVKTEYNIVIGRKGCGKTATLYYLFEALKRHKKNHVILIKPINFEVDGLISLLEIANNEFERGFLIECVWKFLIFSEIAKHIYEDISAKPLYAIKENESKFIDYINERPNLFLADFSSRLEEQINILKNNNLHEIGDGKTKDYRLKVSEALHQGTLIEVREHFSKIVPKSDRIIVLIDNLDKSWRSNAKINSLSKFILGLLGVSGRIGKELELVKNIQTNISFHLTLFLRSDIYRHVMLNAREPDKIEIKKLIWDDGELLFRIIEERFIGLSKTKYEAKDLWEKFFVEKIKNQNIKSYILDVVFPRPRDIIYFIKSAKDKAVSRGHSIIQEDDLISAHKEYSAWIFKSLIVENGISIEQMEDFMYQLMGCNIILSKDMIQQHMVAAKIDASSEEKIEKFIDHIVDLTILGRETKTNIFEFEYDIDSFKKLKILSQKLNSNRYKIHNALVPYLECEE